MSDEYDRAVSMGWGPATNAAPADDLKERLRANHLDECYDAIDRIEELEAKLSKYVKACSDLSQQHISEWGRAEELEAKLAKAVEALRAERDYWVKRADADLADQDANERFMDYPIPRKMTAAMRKADALNAALAAFDTGGKADG